MIEQINKILSDMYTDYIAEGFKPTYEIKEPEANAGYTAEQIVRYMAEHGYVKDPVYRPGRITCTLDLGGIEQADPDYFTDHIDKVVIDLYQNRKRDNIHAILGFPDNHLERSFDIGTIMQHRRLLSAVQTTGAGQIAELSPDGIVYCEERQAEFLD